MGHYAVQQRRFINDEGDYYLHQNGLSADLKRVMSLLNLGEDTENINRTTWNDPGEDGLPHMRVVHAALGETYLPEAIDYFRNRKGVGSFPYSAVPSANEWGSHSTKEGVNMRWIVELLEAVGRGTAASERTRITMESAKTSSSNQLPQASDTLTFGRRSSSATSIQLFSNVTGFPIYVGNVSGYSQEVFSTTYQIRGVDTGVSDISNLQLNDWESQNRSSIVFAAGSGSSSVDSGFSVGPITSPEDKNYYFYEPEQTLELYDFVERIQVDGSGGTAAIARSNTIPSTIGEALANIGATTGRYIYLVPPINVPYEESGVITYLDWNGNVSREPVGNWKYTYQWTCILDFGSVGAGSNWIFWTQPVLPSAWPNDTYTAP